MEPELIKGNLVTSIYMIIDVENTFNFTRKNFHYVTVILLDSNIELLSAPCGTRQSRRTSG